MNLPDWYDSWRLDNGEPSSFVCEACDHEFRIDDIDDELDMCKACAEKEREYNEQLTSDF